MSEEFGGALPTQILKEMARLPAGFLEQVVEYRLFAATFAAVTAAPSSEARQLALQGPYGEEAHDIEFELAAEDDTENDG